MSMDSLNECIKQLEKRSTKTFDDRDYPEYVKYGNCFLKHFGKERVFLVGSTTERLKVKTAKDGGDADFLLLSGKLEIPAENIEFRNDMPCYIRVNVDKSKISKTINLIDGSYLPSDVLRTVGPEVFTFLRGVYLLSTCGTSYSPSNTFKTTFSLPSNVGLALNEYKELKVVGGISTSTRKCPRKRQVVTRNESLRAYIKERLSDVEFFKQDLEIVERIMEFIIYMKTQGSIDDIRLGFLEHFAYLISLLQERSNESLLEESLGENDNSDEETSAVTFENDLESVSDDPALAGGRHVSNESTDFEASQRTVRATYTESQHKDFVPALKIIGPLKCMDAWKAAQHLWLSSGEIDVIAKMDIFFVARYAPINPSRKYFCLSFTLAENKLSECLSPVQRQIVLIMKAFLKGIFTTRHSKREMKLKLTTFHAKTVIYRVSDNTDPSVWSEVDVAACLTWVLTYLKEALGKKELLHYFIPSNLFAGFEDEDFKILLECTDEVMSDPLGGLNAFFKLDDGIPNELWLTDKEVAYLERSSTDDGITEEVDNVKESIFEFLRGLKEGTRDVDGSAPIQVAISTVLDLFFQNFPPRMNQLLSNLGPLMAKAFGEMLANSLTELVLKSFENVLKPHSDEDKRLAFEALKNILVAYVSR